MWPACKAIARQAQDYWPMHLAHITEHPRADPRMLNANSDADLLIFDGRLNDHIRIGDGAILVSRTLFQGIDKFHTRHDFAEHRVLAVQEAAVGIHDEELRIGAVRILRTSSTDSAAHEGFAGK